MARYFKVVEIDCDSFIEATGEDLDCCQLSTGCDGIGYVGRENVSVLQDKGAGKRRDYRVHRPQGGEIRRQSEAGEKVRRKERR